MQAEHGRPERAAGGGWIAAIVALLALLALLLVPLGYRTTWADEIFPGMHVGSVEIGGLAPSAARQLLIDEGFDPDEPATVTVGEQIWAVPADVLRFDLDATVERAFALGRSGARPRQIIDMARLRLRPRRLAPVLIFDEAGARVWLAEQASDYDRVSADATLVIEGTQVVASDAVDGRTLRQEEASRALAEVAAGRTWPPEPVSLFVQPDIPDVRDNRMARARAELLLAGPVELRAFDESWIVDPTDLAPLLLPRVQDDTYRLQVAKEAFGRLLGGVTEAVSRTAKVPRFHFDDEAGELVVIAAGETGRSVNVERTIERLLAMDGDAARRVMVAIDFTAPPIEEDVTAAELGIRELVHEETSYYRGSSPDRVHNVAQAASRFDGMLIPPDEVFSFNETVGDISEEEGYRKTLIILDGATADGVGGGTCQVSTTLYRAAFWTGLPIVERLAHGYRVGYYEQHSPTGMDATVYGPTIDLKFHNDTGGWLLLEAEPDSADRSLTFRLYGTKPKREVSMEGPLIRNRVPPPPPEIVVDPELAPGQERTDELEREGMSVTVERIVVEDGEERRDTFHSSYRPTGSLTAVGPTPAPPQGALAAPPNVP